VKNNLVALTWESDFFSKSIATVTDINKVSTNELASFELVTNKVASDNYSELTQFNKLGFSIAEGELIFYKKVSEGLARNSSIELAKEADISELVSLAENSYVSTRFRHPWFSQNQSNHFYGTWIKNAVLGLFDDVCLIIRGKGCIQGFVSLRKVKAQIKIGLIAVIKAAQGQGIAGQLLTLAEAYARQHQCNQIMVATQTSNISAINLYSRNNFILKESNYWLYKTNY
jgi:dTDP-4-amino-4,6-dideoxy-D-galactose acyltransferase